MGTKSEVFVKLTLVFFISLLSFAVGTFVGKKYSDNQHKLASMEPGGHGGAERSVASEHEAPAAHGEGKSLSDEEIAQLAEEFVSDDKPVAKSDGHGETPAHGEEPAHGEPTQHAAAPAHAENAHTTSAAHEPDHRPSKIAEEVAHGTKPAAAPAPKATPTENRHPEARIPTSIPKDVSQYSVGKFTVQVAAFAAETEAKTKAESLKAQGYSAFYVPATVKGKTWYRVSVGLFATEKEAKEYKVDFVAKSKADSAMVQKISQ